MLKEHDADSAYSGETGSNTDSGRGASEEGETAHHNIHGNISLLVF